MRYNPNQTMFQDKHSNTLGIYRETKLDFEKIYDVICELQVLDFFEFNTYVCMYTYKLHIDKIFLSYNVLSRLIEDGDEIDWHKIPNSKEIKEEIKQLLHNMGTEGVVYLVHEIQPIDATDVLYT